MKEEIGIILRRVSKYLDKSSLYIVAATIKEEMGALLLTIGALLIIAGTYSFLAMSHGRFLNPYLNHQEHMIMNITMILMGLTIILRQFSKYLDKSSLYDKAATFYFATFMLLLLLGSAISMRVFWFSEDLYAAITQTGPIVNLLVCGILAVLYLIGYFLSRYNYRVKVIEEQGKYGT